MQAPWVNKTPGFKNTPTPIYKNSFSFNMHLNLHKSMLFYTLLFLILPIFNMYRTSMRQ